MYSSDEAGMLYSKDKTQFIACPTGYQGSYRIAEGVTEIGGWAFNSCADLVSVEIPTTVKTIGMNAFWECTGLAEITIPASVTEIATCAFGMCTSLKEVYFKGDAPEYNAYADHCFDDMNGTVYYPADNDTWTEDVMKDYGAHLTWIAVDETGAPVEPKEMTQAEFLEALNSAIAAGEKTYQLGQSVVFTDCVRWGNFGWKRAVLGQQWRTNCG